MAGAAVVEPRLQLHEELHLAARYPNLTDDPVAVGRPAFDHRHEVLHLADAIGSQETGDQDRGIREVQLLGDVVVGGRPDAEIAALFGVQQRAEYARRVEARAAEEVDRAIMRYQRSRLQITDQPLITDIGYRSTIPSSRWSSRDAVLRDPSTLQPSVHCRHRTVGVKIAGGHRERHPSQRVMCSGPPDGQAACTTATGESEVGGRFAWCYCKRASRAARSRPEGRGLAVEGI
jgi:hypothetical protein